MMDKRLVVYDPGKKNEGEQLLVNAFCRGLRTHGEQFTVISKQEFSEQQIEADCLVVTGRLAHSSHILHTCRRKGASFIYFDKGYLHRGWNTGKHGGYIRFAINDVHPLRYFLRIPRPSDRWEKLNVRLKPLRQGNHILYADCTRKFAAYHDLDPIAFASKAVETIQRTTDKPILYRQKPSARDVLSKSPIPGTILSDIRVPIEKELSKVFALVTFSSNAALDAIVNGVPAFVLGPGIAKPVSNTDLEKLADPWFPTDAERLRWCHAVAYCQWQIWEIEEGLVWQDLKRLLRIAQADPSNFSNSNETPSSTP